MELLISSWVFSAVLIGYFLLALYASTLLLTSKNNTPTFLTILLIITWVIPIVGGIIALLFVKRQRTT
jgi:hypothetical protein